MTPLAVATSTWVKSPSSCRPRSPPRIFIQAAVSYARSRCGSAGPSSSLNPEAWAPERGDLGLPDWPRR
jgi:hypothetical protein